MKRGQTAERLDDGRVKLLARIAPQLVERRVVADGLPVGPLGRHGVKRVAHGDDAGAKRNVVAA